MVAHAVAAAITKAIANKVLIFFILRFLMSQPAKLRLSESHDACINGRSHCNATLSKRERHTHTFRCENVSSFLRYQCAKVRKKIEPTK